MLLSWRLPLDKTKKAGARVKGKVQNCPTSNQSSIYDYFTARYCSLQFLERCFSTTNFNHVHAERFFYTLPTNQSKPNLETGEMLQLAFGLNLGTGNSTGVVVSNK